MIYLVSALLFVVSPEKVAASDSLTWELTPYRIQLVIATESSAQLPPVLRTNLAEALEYRTDAWVGAAWNLVVANASPVWQRDLKATIENLGVKTIPESSRAFDKLIFLSVGVTPEGYCLAAREYDAATQLVGNVETARVEHVGELADTAFSLLLDVFSPLARAEHFDIETGRVGLRVKAHLLPPRDHALKPVHSGDIFRLVIRYNDRNGNARRINPLPWTYCAVDSVNDSKQTTHRVACRLHSGLRSPLSGRRRGPVEQLALMVRAQPRPTTVVLRSNETQARPLVGYEVHSRSVSSTSNTLLGYTDHRGRISVPPLSDSLSRDDASANDLRLLLIKHGNQILVPGLPIVPGEHEEVSLAMADDDPRLEAEGYVTGLQEALVDLVSRREILVARIRKRIDEWHLDEAQSLVTELRGLPDIHDFSEKLKQRRRSLTADHPVTKMRIERLLGDTERLLQTYLERRADEAVSRELRQARNKTETSLVSPDRE